MLDHRYEPPKPIFTHPAPTTDHNPTTSTRSPAVCAGCHAPARPPPPPLRPRLRSPQSALEGQTRYPPPRSSRIENNSSFCWHYRAHCRLHRLCAAHFHSHSLLMPPLLLLSPPKAILVVVRRGWTPPARSYNWRNQKRRTHIHSRAVKVWTTMTGWIVLLARYLIIRHCEYIHVAVPRSVSARSCRSKNERNREKELFHKTGPYTPRTPTPNPRAAGLRKHGGQTKAHLSCDISASFSLSMPRSSSEFDRSNSAVSSACKSREFHASDRHDD